MQAKEIKHIAKCRCPNSSYAIDNTGYSLLQIVWGFLFFRSVTFFKGNMSYITGCPGRYVNK